MGTAVEAAGDTPGERVAPGDGQVGGSLSVGLLGPFEVALDGRPVTLTTGRLRTVLALLAISAGRPVSIERLGAALWNEDQPSNARRAIQTYVTRLRAVLGTNRISRTANGYVLNTDPERVDTIRFLRLLEAAARSPDAATERARLEEARVLWRGSPFDGVRSDLLLNAQARFVEQYLASTERRVDLDLAAGRHYELIGELRELTARHPLREPLWVRLLTALDRCGRQAEALEQYENIRRRLVEELGTEPGPALRQTHLNLLTRAPARSPVATGRGSTVVPRQLPGLVEGFVGRAADLETLDRLHADWKKQRNGPAASPAFSVISGAAGVGKTTLALRWAHEVAEQFPDGQLYVDLRGFHSSGEPMAPADAVRGFLDALDVPPQRVPASLDAQAALYRSLLPGKRMFVLLDNARDAEQVRPLLPGSPSCFTVVTSRDPLTGLVAGLAAHPLAIGPLARHEARELLAARLGTARIAAEPEPAEEIVVRCAGLPLALAVVAARAVTRTKSSLRAIAEELRAQPDGLAED